MILPHHPNKRNGKHRAIGYWSEDCNPQDFVDPSWDKNQRNAILVHLNNGKSLYRWRGISRCRFCNQRNGSQCMTDGTYVWPSGFAHYISEHGVKPALEFIQHIIPALPKMETQETPQKNIPENYHIGYRCLDCRTVILSLSRHSFITCECYNAETGKGCFIDGGFDYTRGGGNPDRMETVKIKIR